MDQEIAAGRNATLSGNSIRSGADYIESLRGRNLKVYLMGELVAEPVDHPIIRPSINAVAETYDLANSNSELASAMSPLTGERINRFLHIATSSADLVMQNKMQRRLGQLTGTCFQRCVGMDALNALHSVTFDLDRKNGTGYHDRFKDFLARIQRANLMIGGAMTDVKGDRSKSPSQQADRDAPHPAGGLHQRREGAPDRLSEFALADRHADHEVGSRRQGLCHRRRGAGRCHRHHLHLRSAIVRHKKRRKRRDRRGQRAVRRPGGDDRVRGCVRPQGTHLHGR
jgi:hypothetical protein